METSNSIKCRKCGGPHLTMKCEQDKPTKVDNLDKPDNLDNLYNLDNLDNNKNKVDNLNNRQPKLDYSDNRQPKLDNSNYHTNNKDCKVRIANLPVDIGKGELYSLLEEWGNIKSLFIKENYDSCSAFVEFQNSEQSKYFVKALNETPFEYRIITTEIMNN